MIDMTAPMSTMDRLKTETGSHHRHAETRLLQKAMAAGTLDRVTYRRYLAQLLHVHRALDGWLAGVDAQGSVLGTLDHNHHVHVEHLESDIAFLGVTDQESAALPATTRFIERMHARVTAEPLLALGVWYVLEGSMNGNRFIARVLRAAYGGNEAGLSYLDPYGERQREIWTDFRARANEIDVPDGIISSLVETAQCTFDAIAAISDEVFAVGVRSSADSSDRN